jgi:hypothetical protein
MRKFPRLVWTAAVLFGLVGGARAQETPRAVIERAVKAHGGQERLAKIRADRVKIKGTLLVGAKEQPFTGETLVQLPSQFKTMLQLTLDGRKLSLVQVLNGTEAWVTIDGQPQKVPESALAEMRDTLNLDRAVRLVPLLTDKSYELSALDASKVNDRPAVGIKVARKGQTDLRLFFDKDSGLLVKTEHQLTDGQGKQVRQEVFYSDFKDIGGYKRPVKLTVFREGKKFMTAELLEAKYLDKVDASEFAKP